MDSNTIQINLDHTLHQIMQLVAQPDGPDGEALVQAADRLEHFVSRHRADLSFEHFPLPTGTDEVLCSYALHCDARTGLTLWLQAIRAGWTASCTITEPGPSSSRLPDRSETASINARTTAQTRTKPRLPYSAKW